MKKTKDFSKMSVSERMKAAEAQGAKVAIIMNKAREKANKLLAKTGFSVDIKVDFVVSAPKEEVNNG